MSLKTPEEKQGAKPETGIASVGGETDAGGDAGTGGGQLPDDGPRRVEESGLGVTFYEREIERLPQSMEEKWNVF